MRTEIVSPWEPLPEDDALDPLAEGPSALQMVVQGVVTGVLATLFLVFLTLVALIGVYAYYARALPSPQELYQRINPFKSTKIYDRNGRLLFEVFNPDAGRRTIVPYEQIPQVVIAATLLPSFAPFIRTCAPERWFRGEAESPNSLPRTSF
jgi:hypothetical protein